VLVIAVGIFGEPNVIALPGQEDFAGEVWHSSELSDTAVFEMKDVAVIGSGASAVQVVPELAECARSVHVFQREPAWVVPKDDRVYQPTMLRVFKMIPLARRFNRWRLMARHEIQAIRRPGGLRHRRLTSLATRHLQRSIADEEQRRVLQPSYPILCKRLLRTSAYYEALRRANVDLTDRPIERLGPRTIRTTDGVERPADVIVCATGFRPTEYLSSIKVIGPDGDDLTALWRTTGSITTYLGITVPRYPNLFMLYGPNTNSLTAVTYIVEQQTKYVERMVRRLLRSGADAVTVKPAVAEDFERLLSAGLEGSVWAGGCNSYYSNGNGRIVTQWPYSGLRYWWLTHRLRERDYLWA
jgi:cation diffusion facilitator CzcD-associated flavoprotein CzcO